MWLLRERWRILFFSIVVWALVVVETTAVPVEKSLDDCLKQWNQFRSADASVEHETGWRTAISTEVTTYVTTRLNYLANTRKTQTPHESLDENTMGKDELQSFTTNPYHELTGSSSLETITSTRYVTHTYRVRYTTSANLPTPMYTLPSAVSVDAVTAIANSSGSASEKRSSTPGSGHLPSSESILVLETTTAPYYSASSPYISSSNTEVQPTTNALTVLSEAEETFPGYETGVTTTITEVYPSSTTPSSTSSESSTSFPATIVSSSISQSSTTTSSATPLKTATTAIAILTLGSEVITASRLSGHSSKILIGSVTLSPGAPAQTINGQPVSEGRSGLVIGGSTTTEFVRTMTTTAFVRPSGVITSYMRTFYPEAPSSTPVSGGQAVEMELHWFLIPIAVLFILMSI